MAKKTIKEIVFSTKKDLRRRLIAKEVRLLMIIAGAWLVVLLIDAIIYSTTGNSLIMGLFELEGRRSRQSGPIYALFILFGPPLFVVFRLFLFPVPLASRINRELLNTRQINEGDFTASQNLIRSRIGVTILLVLLIILAFIIIIGMV